MNTIKILAMKGNEIPSLPKYPPFILALATPVIISVFMATYIWISDDLELVGFSGGSKALLLFWEYFKVPLAVLAATVPLGAWAIANLRSKEFVASLEKQEAALQKQAEALAQQREMLELQKKAFEAQEEQRKLDLYWSKLDHIAKMASYTIGGKYDISSAEIYIVLEQLFGQREDIWPLQVNESIIRHIGSYYDEIGLRTREALAKSPRSDLEFISDDAASNFINEIRLAAGPSNLMFVYLGWPTQANIESLSDTLFLVMKFSYLMDAIHPFIPHDHKATWPHFPPESAYKRQELIKMTQVLEEHHSHQFRQSA